MVDLLKLKCTQQKAQKIKHINIEFDQILQLTSFKYNKDSDTQSFMGRLLAFCLFALACLLIIHREKFSQRVTRYTPAPSPHHVNEPPTDPYNYYRTGKYDISHAPVPTLNPFNPSTVIDLLSRKKINGFMFVQYNLYKLEINFIDLGYSSLIQINYWTHDVGHQSVEEKVGFSLPEDFNEATLNMDIKKRKFDFRVRQNVRKGKNGQSQTVTSFNITLHQDQIQLFANYTHVRRDDQCATIVRESIISHKCFGGYGYGKVRLNYVFVDDDGQTKKKMSAFNPKTNQTKVAFDGFRGSGWDWKWIWMYSTGFSKPEFYANDHSVVKEDWIGFNIGSLNGKSQDFLFLNGKVYPIEGLKYEIDEKLPVKKNITITATNPQMKVNFEIMTRTVIHNDMGLLKNDMVKGEGHWVGYVIDPENSTHKVDFYEMSGMVELANSVF